MYIVLSASKPEQVGMCRSIQTNGCPNCGHHGLIAIAGWTFHPSFLAKKYYRSVKLNVFYLFWVIRQGYVLQVKMKFRLKWF